MKKMLVLALLAVLLAVFSANLASAVEADLSEAILFTDTAFPGFIKLSNIGVSGNYYGGTFRWNPNRNSLDIVGHEWEAGEEFEIPTRTITIDGNAVDWLGIPAVLTDPVGDDYFGLPGDDIQEVFLAKDNDFMYFGIKIADGAPLSDGSGHMHFQFSLTSAGWSDLVILENHFAVFTTVSYDPPNWDVRLELHVVHPLSGAIPVHLYDYDPATHVGVGAEFVEWKVPIDDCMVTSGKYAEAWTHYETQPSPSDVAKGVRVK